MARERARPQPSGEEACRLESLRLLCGRLLADDHDHPLSDLNACDVPGLPAARVRAWARSMLAALQNGGTQDEAGPEA